jgi:conjugal transfer pilus assembly protein TraD
MYIHSPGDAGLALLPIGGLFGQALHTPVILALGVLAGLLIARAVHRHRLRWTWAALALPVTVPTWAADPQAGLGLCAAALTACRLAARWQRQEREAGGDLAQLATDRIGPARVLRRILLAHGYDLTPPYTDEGLRIGYDDAGHPVRVPFGGRSGSHTLVLGATGSGKTETETALAVRAVEHGLGVIAVDPKGDRRLEQELRRVCAERGHPFSLWSPEGESVYNPYARGGDTEIADKALLGERWTEPHYLRQAQRYLGHEVRTLRAAGISVTLAALVAHLEPARLEAAARGLDAQQAAPVRRYLDRLTRRQRADLAGVRDRLAILAESAAGRWLDPVAAGPQAPVIDLLSVARRGEVVLFRLDADRQPLLSAMLGAAVVADLVTVAASLQDEPARALVLIDEFSAVGAEPVGRLFGRARSAGLSLVLGTQEFADLRKAGRSELVDQVLGNLAALVAHRQAVPASAELVAEMAGHRGVWIVTRRESGPSGRGRRDGSSRTRGSEPVLDADRVRRLDPGEAVVLVPGGATPVAVTRITRSDARR